MGLDIDVYKPIKLTSEQILAEELKDIRIYPEPHELIEKFPEFVFEKEYDVYDWITAFEGKNPDDYEFDGSETDGWNDKYEFIHKITKEHIFIINPPTVKKNLKSIAVQSIGNQRKGANQDFYEDDIWDTWVYDSRTLNEHWKKYFSSDTTKEDGNIYGFSVEYHLTAKENSDNFKRNIINKFIEGETAVVYH